MDKIKSIIDIKYGHITGKLPLDTVYLRGEVTSESSGYASNIDMVILQGSDNKEKIIPLNNAEGYNFTIFLGDFTGLGKDDIFIRGLYGGSAGLSWNYIYSYSQGEYKLIFNGEDFSKTYGYEARYENHYKLKVSCPILKKSYLIDISKEDKVYLNIIYDEKEIFKNNVVPIVYDISSINPVDYGLWKYYGLFINQRIIGQSNADTLGIVETLLRWNEGEFRVLTQNIAIRGYEDATLKFSTRIEVDEIIYISPENIKQGDLEKAILEELEFFYEEGLKYYYNKIDLNDKGFPDIIVYVSDVSNSRGDFLLVFRIEKGEYVLISKIYPVKAPIIISDEKNNSYKNLITYVDDLGSKRKHVNLTYDGEKYIENPFLGDEVPFKSTISGIGLFHEKYSKGVNLLISNKTNNRIGKNRDLRNLIKEYLEEHRDEDISVEDIQLVKTTEIRLGIELSRKYAVAYKFREKLFLCIMDNSRRNLRIIINIHGKGKGTPYINYASLRKKYMKDLIIAWKVSTDLYELHAYSYEYNKLKDLIDKEVKFSFLDIVDIKPKDGIDEIAIWNNKYGKYYEIEVLKYKEGHIIEDKILSTEYCKKLVEYYINLIEGDACNPSYWYFLACALIKLGNKAYALKAANKNLTFNCPYPSIKEAEKLKKELSYMDSSEKRMEDYGGEYIEIDLIIERNAKKYIST
ncbi:MAG: hypothetical protein RSB70_00065 [Clostridium sp.]